jgi:hypothetical protein
MLLSRKKRTNLLLKTFLLHEKQRARRLKRRQRLAKKLRNRKTPNREHDQIQTELGIEEMEMEMMEMDYTMEISGSDSDTSISSLSDTEISGDSGSDSSSVSNSESNSSDSSTSDSDSDESTLSFNNDPLSLRLYSSSSSHYQSRKIAGRRFGHRKWVCKTIQKMYSKRYQVPRTPRNKPPPQLPHVLHIQKHNQSDRFRENLRVSPVTFDRLVEA